MTHPKEQLTREQFEKWYTENVFNKPREFNAWGFSLVHGNYRVDDCQLMFAAWQAALSTLAPVSVPISKEAQEYGLPYCCGREEKALCENADLRNIVQVALHGTREETVQTWNKYFPDRQLSAAPTVSQGEGGWISVAERLPEIGEPVWISFFQFNDPSKERMQTVAVLDNRGDWYDPTYDCMMHPATHWQPLPSPPKREES